MTLENPKEKIDIEITKENLNFLSSPEENISNLSNEAKIIIEQLIESELNIS
jgi:hypothetical protein